MGEDEMRTSIMLRGLSVFALAITIGLLRNASVIAQAGDDNSGNLNFTKPAHGSGRDDKGANTRELPPEIGWL